MEHNDGGLEDDIPVQSGDFLGSMSIFRAVALHFQIYHVVLVKKNADCSIEGYSVRVHG